MKLYLDTSVPNAYLDASWPERQEATRNFWRRLRRFEPYISALVLEEIGLTPDPTRRRELRAVVAGIPRIPIRRPAIRDLAARYLELAALPPRALADATHVAAATVHGLTTVVSWNLRDLVNVRARTRVNAVNALRGYPPIEIVTPPMLE